MRLIDADALEKILMAKGLARGYFTRQAVINEIKFAPTIDAEPVRHGTWETVLYEQSGRINSYAHACPKCKYVYKDFKPLGHNFCPNCGKPMDGGGSNER